MIRRQSGDKEIETVSHEEREKREKETKRQRQLLLQKGKRETKRHIQGLIHRVIRERRRQRDKKEIETGSYNEQKKRTQFCTFSFLFALTGPGHFSISFPFRLKINDVCFRFLMAIRLTFWNNKYIFSFCFQIVYSSICN